MSKPLDSPSNESAYNYAFALAMRDHLAEVETRFAALPAEDFQSLEQTLWAQDMTTNLHLVGEFGLHRLAEYYRKEDLALNSPQGQYKSALSYTMETQLLGPRVKTIHDFSTEQLLTKVDEVAPFTGVLLYTNQLRKKLYLVLTNAAKVVTGATGSDPQIFLAISTVLAEYLSHMAADMSSQLDIGALSMHIDSTVSHLRHNNTVSCEYSNLFKVFRAMLASQLEVASTRVDEKVTTLDLVLRLRETGNNLMSISSYPQAIKVYTEALDLCDWTCSNNIPQLYTNRAISFIGLNCFVEAVSDLDHAVNFDRTFVPAWAQLGYCHLYLGSGLLALRCYLTALRCVAGEIYPENFPISQEMRAEYTNNKVLTFMPQFVQRLVQSIILSEKRALQQRLSSVTVQELTTRTRAILARLRAACAPEDLSYLSYTLENAAETVRATATRANRTRPSILTPDVAQDIMASTNVEASAVTILPPIVLGSNANATATRPGGAAVNNASDSTDTNGPATTAEATAAEGAPAQETPGQDAQAQQTFTFNFSEDAPEGLRSMLNNLGEAFGDIVQNQFASNARPNGSTAQGEGSGGDTQARAANGEATPHTGSVNSNGGPGQTETRTPNATAEFRGPLNTFIPELTGNLGGIISQALRHHRLVMRDRSRVGSPITRQTPEPAGSPSQVPGSFPSVRVTASPSSRQTNGVANPGAASQPLVETQSVDMTPGNSRDLSVRPDDTDMPDAPDLD